jgi:uroporphyrinogen-III synthase
MRLIVTRPEPDDMRTARALIRLGHEVILSPMLDIVPIAGLRLADRTWQAVLVTSANAVRMLARMPARPFPANVALLAVGDQTALEARRAGFVAARSAGGAMDNLLALAQAELSPDGGPLLYLAGETQAGDLAGELTARGFEVETAILYRSEPREKLAGVAEDALRAAAVDGVLFYSRRSVEAFERALRRARLSPLGERVVCFCLSETVAEAARVFARGAVHVSETPDQISLFVLIEQQARPTATNGATRM